LHRRNNCSFACFTLIKNFWFCFQLRLDFISLTITGPSTITIPDGQIKGGNLVLLVAAFNQVQVSRATQCRTDTFSITSPGGSPPPVICGTNSGQHSKKLILFNKYCVTLFSTTASCHTIIQLFHFYKPKIQLMVRLDRTVLERNKVSYPQNKMITFIAFLILKKMPKNIVYFLWSQNV
jgi:hypothetical protein